MLTRRLTQNDAMEATDINHVHLSTIEHLIWCILLHQTGCLNFLYVTKKALDR